MLDIAPDWAGGIDEFVAEANTWLARVLPDDRAARPKDEVNARLVRHYTTLGLLPAPRREGREARYGRSHLVHLLALRRLMADGLSGRVLAGTLAGRSVDELEHLAERGAVEPLSETVAEARTVSALVQMAPSPALEYVQALKGGRMRRALPPAVQGLRSLVQAPARPSIPSQSWTRLLLRPGLEVQVGEHFRWPRDAAAWDALMDELRESLVDVRSQQRGASVDDT